MAGGHTSCGLPVSQSRNRRSLRSGRPSTMLEIARDRVSGSVPSQFYQIVSSSSLELSSVSSQYRPSVSSHSGPSSSHRPSVSSQYGPTSSHRPSNSSDVQTGRSVRGQGKVAGRRRRRQRKRRKSLGSVFQHPSSPSWSGQVAHQSGSPCPVYLVSPSHALSPAPCLLGGDTSPSSLTVRLGPHSRSVSSLLLHPTREGHDLALLGLTAPLPTTRPPACLSPITSKYSLLLCSSSPYSALPLKTVNRRKCGKLGRDQVCVSMRGVEGKCRPQAGDPVVTSNSQGQEVTLEGFYLRWATPEYHVITDLFQLRMWVEAALQL